MRIAITGGTGLVGRFVVDEALARGDRVTLLARRPPGDAALAGHAEVRQWALGQAPDLTGQDALVHAAFAHVPGRYRGGEGDDPEGFLRDNLGGSRALFEAAAAAGLARVVFLSSRAVYGVQPPGASLHEATSCRPDTLYGRMKRDAEAALAAADVRGVALRATGVYGPAPPRGRHKWADLFADFDAGRPVAPRAGSEVHGADLAVAVRIALTADSPPVLNVSDILLDRRDLLAAWIEAGGAPMSRPGALPDSLPDSLPPRADASGFNLMDTSRLRGLGWTPGGMDRLRETLKALATPPP